MITKSRMTQRKLPLTKDYEEASLMQKVIFMPSMDSYLEWMCLPAAVKRTLTIDLSNFTLCRQEASCVLMLLFDIKFLFVKMASHECLNSSSQLT